MTDQQTAEKAEIVESEQEATGHSPVKAARRPPDSPLTLFGTTNPTEVVAAATETATALTAILEERELYKQIGDRRHVLIEGWTLLGSMLGVFASTVEGSSRPVETEGEWRPPQFHTEERTLHSKWCKNGPGGHQQQQGCKTYTKDARVVDADGKGGWEARAEARTLDGRLVAAAEAECRWDEWTWRDRESHALRSMAQTRAQSKALASALRFVVELAGFSGTPAEEMPDDAYQTPPPNGAEDEGPTFEHKPGHPVYDNRGDERSIPKSEGGQGWPVFKCKRKDCTDGSNGRPWASWNPHEFTDPEVRAKQKIVQIVAKHKTGWKVYLPEEAPDYDDSTRQIVQAAHEADDERAMAGVLWNRLYAAASTGLIWDADEEDRPNRRDFEIMTTAAENALAQAETDAADIILEPEALMQAGQQIYEREAEAASHMSDY